MDFRIFVESLTLAEMNELANIIHDKRVEFATRNAQPLNNNEINLIIDGKWIDAIKAYRQRFNCSLLIAKCAVDAYNQSNIEKIVWETGMENPVI